MSVKAVKESFDDEESVILETVVYGVAFFLSSWVSNELR